jgi:hypothetical protein
VSAPVVRADGVAGCGTLQNAVDQILLQLRRAGDAGHTRGVSRELGTLGVPVRKAAKGSCRAAAALRRCGFLQGGPLSHGVHGV